MFVLTFVLILIIIRLFDLKSFESLKSERNHFEMNNNTLRPDLSIYTLTWNVKSEQPKSDFSQLLNLRSTLDVCPTASPLADLYVIGLQEVPVYYFWNNPWIESFDRVFKQIDYTRVKYNRLLGILLLVYVRRNHLPKFRSIETETTVTGFGGFWGNKGGVSVSLTVDGISICLLNSHMAAHYENLEQRITEYNAVIDGQSFRDRNKPQILSHDYVIWIGDLNFRIDDLSGDQIHQIIERIAQNNSSDYSELLEKDQLNRVRREGRAFSEFTETVPTFAPTYKFFVNTDNYDYKSRKPAFTDRTLYRFSANNYDNFKLDLKQIEYKSHPQYKQSDHKPVTAVFHLKTKKSYNRLLSKRQVPSLTQQTLDTTDSADKQIFVTFLPITNWKVNQDSTAWYTITGPDYDESIGMLSPWDWIGLYKSDFISIDEHFSYVWANPGPNRWTPPPVPSPNNLNDQNSSQSQSEAVREPWFLVQYSDQSLLVSDEFRLVYVTQNGDVLGISDPFFISN